jgi:hypothetical protein
MSETPQQVKAKWFQTWWGIALMAVAGAVLPQLCVLIPNAFGAGICSTVVKVAVVALQGAPSAVASLPPDAPLPDADVCPPERRLSTGQCLPAVDVPPASPKRE